MNGFIGALVLAFMAFGASAQTTNEQNLRAVEREAWRLTCLEMKADCKFIYMPLVGYSVFGNGLHGLYEIGSHTVLINMNVIGQPFHLIVLVHEMVHYLQSTTNTHGTKCESEERAFRVAFKVALDLNIQDNRIPTWTEIKGQYGCGFIKRPYGLR